MRTSSSAADARADGPAPAPGLRDALFPAVGEGRVEAVVRRLGEAIALGLLDVGERLPPEAELAARFGVAPMTLREALAVLRQADLLETRRGRGGGTFVKAHVPAGGAVPAAGDGLAGGSADDLRDLNDLHRAIAGAAAALAAQRAAPAELAHLRVLAERMGRGAPTDEVRRSDARFHIEIAAASRSARLTQAEIDLQSELRDLMGVLAARPRVAALAARQHLALLAALDRRDAEAARRLAEQHVDSTVDLIVGLGLTTLDG